MESSKLITLNDGNLNEIDFKKNKIYVERLEKLFTIVEINNKLKISPRIIKLPKNYLPYNFKP